MLSWLAAVWMTAAIGQHAPAEAAWLKSVPADIPVVLRARALGDVGGELRAMLRAMSPAASEAAEDWIEPGLRAFRTAFGDEAGTAPFLVLSRLPDVENPAATAWALIVKSGNYEGV